MNRPEVKIGNVRLEYTWVRYGSKPREGHLFIYFNKSNTPLIKISQRRLARMTLNPLLRGICGLPPNGFWASVPDRIRKKVNRLVAFINKINKFNKHIEKLNAKISV